MLSFLPTWSFSRIKPAAATPELKAAAARLRATVEVLATDIGPRHVGVPERYKLAERFLESSLAKMGYEVLRQEIQAPGMVCANLEARIPGAKPGAAAIVVGAHYDSVPGCPAANDNGSGVAGVLEVARAFAKRRRLGGGGFERELRFVLFVNEEPPFFHIGEMGSQHYARACRKRGDKIDGMVCLETIGYYSDRPRSQMWPHPLLAKVLPDRADFIAFVGSTPARRLIRRAARSFRRRRAFTLLAATAPSKIDHVNWSDHRGFIECGYPAFMVTDTALFRYKHYHHPTDTANQLDYVSMARVVTGVVGMVEELAGPARSS